jgi:hypothetical protein
MRYLIHASAIAIAVVGNSGFAAGQNSSGQDHLSQTQQQVLKQDLDAERIQTAPSGGQSEVGSKLPNSLQGSPMPGNVATDVPQAKHLLFVKLSDRILLIDPDSNLITEIVPVTETTGGTTPKQ